MEDLWCVQKAGIDLDEFSDLAEYKRFLRRFCREEEQEHRRRLLYEKDRAGQAGLLPLRSGK